MTKAATTLTTTDAQRLFDTHAAAWNTGDAAGMAAAYERDGRLLDPFGGLADGAEEIATRFAEIHQTVMRGTTTTCSVESVRAISDDLAVADGTQIIDGATAPDGTRLPELALHFTAILRSTDDGLGILECRPYAFLPAG